MGYTDPTGEIAQSCAAPPITGLCISTAQVLFDDLVAIGVAASNVYNKDKEDEDEEAGKSAEFDEFDDSSVQEEYDSFEVAVGSVNDIDQKWLEGKTKDLGLRSQGFTEKHTGIASKGDYQSAFKNPQTGKWTGGHESSMNDKYW